MPIGVASTSLACAMPGASTARTCAGSGRPSIVAASAGTRLSRTSVVLPDPDTPVTTLSRPFGNATSSGFTVWMAAVFSRIAPSARSGENSADSA